MKITKKSKVIAVRGNDYLITNAELKNGKYDSDAEAIVYSNQRNKILGTQTIGAIICRGYWKECENDKKVIEKVKNVFTLSS